MDNNAQKQTVAESMESDLRRSSILKQQKHRSPLTPVDVEEQSADTTLAKQNRRVSFASSNFVKQFAADPEKNTIWDTTYEETLSHTTDSSKDTQSSVELTQKASGKTTVYFSDKDGIEVNEQIFEKLPPELVMDKENLVVRKRSYDRSGIKESPMQKEANVSHMEITETIGKIEETIRKPPVVLYRNESCFDEETIMGGIRDETLEMEFTGCIAVVEKTVTNAASEMEYTECFPVMMHENLEEVNGDSLEGTAVVGGIVKDDKDKFKIESQAQQIEQDTQNNVEITQKEGRRTTIYFGDNDDSIEIDEKTFERLPPELVVEKENLVARKRSYERSNIKESPMQKRPNVSRMEFTETFGMIEETVRNPPIVLYRSESCSTDENSMVDADRGEVREIELTECFPVMFIKNDKKEFETPLLDIESQTQHTEQYSCKSPAKEQFSENITTDEKEIEEQKVLCGPVVEFSVDQRGVAKTTAFEKKSSFKHSSLLKTVTKPEQNWNNVEKQLDLKDISHMFVSSNTSAGLVNTEQPISKQLQETTKKVLAKEQNTTQLKNISDLFPGISVDMNLSTATENGLGCGKTEVKNVEKTTNSSAAVLTNKELPTFKKIPDTDEKVARKNLALQVNSQPKHTIHNISSVEQFVRNADNNTITNPKNVVQISNSSIVSTGNRETSEGTETRPENPIPNKKVVQMFPVVPANTELPTQNASFSSSVSVVGQTKHMNTSRLGNSNNNSVVSINPEETGENENHLSIKKVIQMPTTFDQNISKDRVKTTKLRLNFCPKQTLEDQIEIDTENQERVAQMSFNRSKSNKQKTIADADDTNKTVASFVSMKTSFVDQPSQLSNTNTSNFIHYGAHCDSLMPESCSMHLNFSASTDDTQYLIACNLSANKQQANSEYSKILTEDYNPSPVNSKLLALSAIGSSALSNYLSDRCHVSLPMEVDDEKSETVADCSKLSQEDISLADSFAVISTSANRIAEEMSVRQDEVMKKLVVVKRRQKENFDSKKFQANVEKLVILDGNIKELFKAIERAVAKKNDDLVRYSTETSSSRSAMEVTEASSILELSKEKQEEGTSVVEQIKTKANASKYYWQISFEKANTCSVSTLYGAITSDINFDPTNGKIENIATNVHIKDRAKPISKYVSRQFAKKLSPEILVACLGQNFDILSFLDYVQLTLQYFLELLDTHNELVKTYSFEMHEDMTVTFTVISVELMLIWKVEVNLTDEILTEDSIRVEAQLGAVNERAVRKCLNGCPQGFAAFAPFASNIRAYMNSLKRPLKS